MITPPADVHPRPLGCISNESPFSYHKHSCLLQIMESNESCHMFCSERISNPSHMVERPWFGLVWSSLCGPQLTRGTRRSRGKCMDADRESTERTPQGVLLITMLGCVAHLSEGLVSVVSQSFKGYCREPAPFLMMMLSDLTRGQQLAELPGQSGSFHFSENEKCFFNNL